jgi:hypothetical protein
LSNILFQVTDPTAPHIQEGAGAVASDSLAAESARAGGKFSSNRGSEPLGVKGSNSTFANTNTSGAVTLEPAPNAPARQEQKGGDDPTYPEASGGQSKATPVENKEGSYEAGEAMRHFDIAPTYVLSQYIKYRKPKGKNLKEEDFDIDDSKNASFISEIGDKNDPARLAEYQFEQRNCFIPISAGLPKMPIEVDDPFDVLPKDVEA